MGAQGSIDPAAVASDMAQAIAHRGPDDSGYWMDSSAEIVLVHRRLAIQDLSPSGHQPMVSASGRYVVVFNGEIYNHLDLRKALDGHAWCGHSDTETMLAAIERWGLEAALKKFVGMFAFALWDSHQRVLSLCRDRLGEKPLYYGRLGGVFGFASELKALRAHPAFRADIDRNALALYMRHNVVPAPYSIYKGINKLPPGSWLSFRPGENQLELRSYWSIRGAVEAGQREPFSGSDIEARDALDSLLRQAVSGQMLSDVSLGAFLSGGLDSSTIVALMQAQSPRPISTFTIGFQEAGFNEAEHAKAVAVHLGTSHTELYVTAEQAVAIAPRLPELFDEPFADSSQIPTFLVSELARRHVSVSLSGDGGDELFGGYNRYLWMTTIWRRVGWMPPAIRAAIAGLLTSVPPSAWNRAFSGLAKFVPAGWRYANPGDKVHKLAEVVAGRTPMDIYLALVSHWMKPADIVVGAVEPETVLTDASSWPEAADFESRMMYLDQITYLPDDILTKIDRTAMAVSLETRVPLLDHRIVEFAWSLPLSMKIRNGQTKWLLRQVLGQYVPASLIERPKMGFGVPLGSWLRGPLRPWAESLLNESLLRQEEFFNPRPIREKWEEHLAGKRNWSYHLWDVLVFQAWKQGQS